MVFCFIFSDVDSKIPENNSESNNLLNDKLNFGKRLRVKR